MSDKTKEPPTDEDADALIERARLCFQACEGLPDSALERGSVARLVRAASGFLNRTRHRGMLEEALEPFKELV